MHAYGCSAVAVLACFTRRKQHRPGIATHDTNHDTDQSTHQPCMYWHVVAAALCVRSVCVYIQCVSAPQLCRHWHNWRDFTGLPVAGYIGDTYGNYLAARSTDAEGPNTRLLTFSPMESEAILFILTPALYEGNPKDGFSLTVAYNGESPKETKGWYSSRVLDRVACVAPLVTTVVSGLSRIHAAMGSCVAVNVMTCTSSCHLVQPKLCLRPDYSCIKH